MLEGVLKHFAPPPALVDLINEARTRAWNRVVPARSKLIREEEDHYVFLHHTKGFRRISKRRLGL